MQMKATINRIEIELMTGDVLQLPVDAVVVETDPNLTISKRLQSAAGAAVQAEAREIGWCDVGFAVVTRSGSLPHAKNVIHAVAPRWGEDSARGKLGLLTWRCLHLAENQGAVSVALPPLAVGTNGYPVENCSAVMLERAVDFTFEELEYVEKIMLCTPDEAMYTIFSREFERQIRDLRESGDAKVHV
jgi:O-acetyl-ADP-ribose deacetylase (regulator of RNase III)